MTFKIEITPENPQGLKVNLTAEELEQQKKDVARATADKEAWITKKNKEKIDAKAGNDKLVALGLSQDQVTAMTGYIPLSVRYQQLIDAGETPEEATAITGYTPEE